MEKYNYGIFKATCEIDTKNLDKDRLLKLNDLWRVVERDENIDKPLEVFNTKSEAIESLKKYTSDEHITQSFYGGYCINYTVYFMAELDLLDDERANDLNAYVNGDGYKIAPLVTNNNEVN